MKDSGLEEEKLMNDVIKRILEGIKYGMNQVPHDDDVFLLLAYTCTFIKHGLTATERDMHEMMEWLCDTGDEYGQITLESVYRYIAKLSKQGDDKS